MTSILPDTCNLYVGSPSNEIPSEQRRILCDFDGRSKIHCNQGQQTQKLEHPSVFRICSFYYCAWLVTALTFAQVIVFLYVDASPFVVYIPLTRPENGFFVTRLFTYALVHADRVHLVSNLFVQIVAGALVEATLGTFVFASIYITGVVGGLLAEAATLQVPEGYSTVVVVGASCGVYALLLTGLAYVLINYDDTKYASCVVMLYVILILIEIVANTTNPVDNVTYVGHAVGAAYGLLVGIAVVPNHYKLPWERNLRLWSKIIVPFSIAILLTISLTR